MIRERTGRIPRLGSFALYRTRLKSQHVAESVEVSASVQLLETETSTTGTVVNGEFFQRMPLYQRHPRAVFEDLVIGSGKGGSLAVYLNDGRGLFRLLQTPALPTVAPRAERAPSTGRPSVSALPWTVRPRVSSR